jgi:hypothetical protein
VLGYCKHDDESSGYIKGGEFLNISRRAAFHGVNYVILLEVSYYFL